MNAILADIIRRFRAAQDRGVATLLRLGVPLPASNREWGRLCAARGIYQTRELDGIGIYVHGYGIELILDDVSIDWDWGDAGEPDGFDAWRLWVFVSQNHLDVGIAPERREAFAQIGAWLEESHLAGELTRDMHLYYSPLHRATRNRDGDIA
jgi:hypothetical protein